MLFDTAEIPWWAWVRRFHLPEAEKLNGRAAMVGYILALGVDQLTGEWGAAQRQCGAPGWGGREGGAGRQAALAAYCTGWAALRILPNHWIAYLPCPFSCPSLSCSCPLLLPSPPSSPHPPLTLIPSPSSPPLPPPLTLLPSLPAAPSGPTCSE